MLSRSLEELETIRQIGERRRIEIGEKKLRRQILSNSSFSSDADTSTVTVRSRQIQISEAKLDFAFSLKIRQ